MFGRLNQRNEQPGLAVKLRVNQCIFKKRGLLNQLLSNVIRPNVVLKKDGEDHFGPIM